MFEDVDTYGEVNVQKNKLKGRKKIIINSSYDEFLSDPKKVI